MLLEFLQAKPSTYLDELVIFLQDEFETYVSESTVSRTLKCL